MVDVVSTQRHLVGLGQTLAVDGAGAGGVAVGGAELGRGGREAAGPGPRHRGHGGGEGVGGGHLQGPGVVVDRDRGGGIHRLAPPHNTHSLEQRGRYKLGRQQSGGRRKRNNVYPWISESINTNG